MEFEWDEDKRRQNLRKHGIDFMDTAELFTGPLTIRADERQDYGEDRFVGLGRVKDRLVAVAFTKRGEKIRIISMRKGNSRERARFEKEITD